jgi:photosystem II stability/assembly factor-like uncharacterized protein
LRQNEKLKVMKVFFSPTKLIVTVAALLLLIPASAQWNNIAPANGGQSIKFVSSTTGFLQGSNSMEKTIDGGVTWNTIDAVAGAFSCEGMFWLTANDGFAVFSENLGSGNYAGWFKKTSNGGATWTTIQQVSSNRALYSVWFTSSTTGYVAGMNGAIYKTTNGGTSWSTLTSTTTLSLYTIQFVNATTGYAAGDDGIILKTTNAGSTWSQQFSSIYYEFLDMEFTDALNGCATGSYGLMRTTNGGINWNPVTVYGTTQFIAIDFPSADTGYMTAPGGNVFRTVDGGASWIGLNRVGNQNYFVRDVDFISNDTGFVTMDFSGTWKTTNAGTGCPTITVQNTVSIPDTIHGCAGGHPLFTLSASALNPYVYTFSPSAAIDDTLSYGQYYYTTDTVEGDTLPIVIVMIDTVTGCSAVTDMIVVVTDSVTYQPPPQSTQAFLLCPGDSIVLDLGSNAQGGYDWLTTGDTTQTIIVDTLGMWTGTAHACGGSPSWMFFVMADPNCTQVCAVDAGPDTTFCQQHGQLNAVPASPGNYSFVWSPATGLDNPYAQNPNVISGVNNQQYIVTMTDIANNCVAMDTVVVSAYYFSSGDTFLHCNNQPVTLDFGPGATNYFWQFFTDTSGNTTNINATTQTLVVSQPGTYMGFAMFPNCGALTSVFHVVDSCLSTCTASLTQQILSSNSCGDSVRFIGSYSGTIGAWGITVNNSQSASGFGGTPLLDVHLGAGTYTVVFSAWDQTNSCLAWDTLIYVGTNGLSVATNTIQVCGVTWNSVAFNPIIMAPSTTNLVYQWTPSTGLSNPNIPNPFVNSVFNGSYTFTVTDTVTGCIASDTVQGVYVSNYVNDTVYNCNAQPVYLSAGAANSTYNYSWNTGATTNAISVTAPGQYLVVVMTGNCTFTSVFTVIDSCSAQVGNVWPGDCNYDLVVNMADALHIGLGYGATDALRPNASNAWYAQPMVDWSLNYVNCNYKHGDANGDGIIDVNDTLPIALNYTLTHPFRLTQPQIPATAPTLQLVAQYDTVGLQTLVRVDVVLGTASDPMDSLYGISFRITSDAALIDTNLTVINANTSWLGTTGGNMFTFQKHFQENAIVDFAEVKNNHVNTVNGSGVLASFFIVTTDNLSGIAICDFHLSDVTCVTESQTYITLNVQDDSVVIDPTVPANVVEVDEPVQFLLYPNPAKENVTVQTSQQVSTIEICDMTGRVVQTIIPSGTTTVIQTSTLAEGVYLINVKNGSGVITQKLTIAR